jgi:hypothetical protein
MFDWDNGYTNDPDLIIIHYVLVLKYHTVTHEYMLLLCVN